MFRPDNRSEEEKKKQRKKHIETIKKVCNALAKTSYVRSKYAKKPDELNYGIENNSNDDHLLYNLLHYQNKQGWAIYPRVGIVKPANVSRGMIQGSQEPEEGQPDKKAWVLRSFKQAEIIETINSMPDREVLHLFERYGTKLWKETKRKITAIAPDEVADIVAILATKYHPVSSSFKIHEKSIVKLSNRELIDKSDKLDNPGYIASNLL